MINSIVVVKSCRFTSKELIGQIGVVISNSKEEWWNVQFRRGYEQNGVEEILMKIHQDDFEVIGTLNFKYIHEGYF
ncbi:hypothetical protein [Peribacillus simplex]|uniref:Uncharacterized protein n=1 Tax=Peribacillus simplex TaxID=1478 RepID=A0A9X8RDH5_9BACI|nr:hypothetical protein [Peribacillus simplex]WHY58928.1 hypothetical protein QNH43_12035 [Peribacillus simplex]SIR99926.1 hypothetical protein SAMN05878482_108203 [Peribacillus simplex]